MTVREYSLSPTGCRVFRLLVFCLGHAESPPRLTCWPQEESKSPVEQSHCSQATLTEASLAHPLIYSRKSSALTIIEQSKRHGVQRNTTGVEANIS